MSTVLHPPIAGSTTASTHAELLIEPPRRWVSIEFAELWRHHELLYFLARRDVTVRYKQTVLGAAWAIVQPLTTMLILTLFFGRMAGMTTGDIPYSIFCFAGLLPWTFFVNGLTQSANSLVGNTSLITKVYFPRMLVPMAATLSGLVDLLLSFVVLLGLMCWYGIAPTPRILLVPIPMLLALIAGSGAGLWLAALNVQFRDIRHTLPFLCQVWMFASPVIYPSNLVTGTWAPWCALNPMTGAIDWFRWSLLNTPAPSILTTVAAIVVSLTLLASGALYFRSMERGFADVI